MVLSWATSFIRECYYVLDLTNTISCLILTVYVCSCPDFLKEIVSESTDLSNSKSISNLNFILNIQENQLWIICLLSNLLAASLFDWRALLFLLFYNESVFCLDMCIYTLVVFIYHLPSMLYSVLHFFQYCFGTYFNLCSRNSSKALLTHACVPLVDVLCIRYKCYRSLKLII